jgi:ribosomal-protein-serine acetyltransferase
MNPILLDFPDQFETDRLLLRAPKPGDGAVLNEAIRESAESLKPWMPFVNPVPTVADSEEFVRRACAKFILREDLMLLLFDKHSGRLVGSSGLHRMDWAAGRFEIGYWLRDSAVRCGYATEAVNGITSFAATHLAVNRIEIRCDARNHRSRRVAERCGFHLETVIRNDRLDMSGNLSDTCLYAKVRLPNGELGYPAD